MHCASANRVGAVWLPYRVLDQNVPLEEALPQAQAIGLRSPEFIERAHDYIRRHRESLAAEQSVAPGINDKFLDPLLDTSQWLGRFEVESREIFAARHAIVEALQIPRGARVADIGAGTGFFTRQFSSAVESDGWVFAVEISQRFVEYIRQQVEHHGIVNVTPVLGLERSITLPPSRSISRLFVIRTITLSILGQHWLPSIGHYVRRAC